MYRFLISLSLVIFAFSVTAQIRMKKEDGGILFTENGKNVLFYQIDPKSKDGKYERCHYFHPLWAADGTVLTEDFPGDHLHHRGIFWAWHQVWIDGLRIGDPWEIKSFEQNIAELEFVAQQNGIGVLNSEVEWMSDKWYKNGRKAPYMRETTTVSIHPRTGNYRRIDFEIHLLALEDNLTIGGSEDVKGYSGFSIRMKLPKDIEFSGKNGSVKATNTAVQSPGFINISGSILENGKNGGIVIVDHSDNPAYPQPWILRERRSMQNAAFPGNKVVPVSTSEPLTLKYSLLVYSGKMNNSKIQKAMK